MEIYHHFSEFAGKPLGAVTVGNFDGLHLGHQALIEKLIEEAASEPSLVITFEPHPKEVLSPPTKIPRLMSHEDFARELEKKGVQKLLKLKFDEKLMNTSAQDFMEWMWKAGPFRHLIVGYDFVLGAHREGNAKFLASWCAQRGVKFHQIPPVQKQGLTVSSHQIREFLIKAEVGRARDFLGRPFALTGPVVKGDQRGRQLQFPTANVRIPAQMICPAKGVYAGKAKVQDREFLAVCNLGVRPTFHSEESNVVLEVHLLDFSEEIYGENLRFDFYVYLRGEKKFSSKEELVSQIHRDVEDTRSRMRL